MGGGVGWVGCIPRTPARGLTRCVGRFSWQIVGGTRFSEQPGTVGLLLGKELDLRKLRYNISRVYFKNVMRSISMSAMVDVLWFSRSILDPWLLQNGAPWGCELVGLSGLWRREG